MRYDEVKTPKVKHRSVRVWKFVVDIYRYSNNAGSTLTLAVTWR